MSPAAHRERTAPPLAAPADFAGFWWGSYYASGAEEVCAAG